MPPPIAYFGIESKSLSLVIDLLILFVVVLYFSLLYWTYADARRRIADPMLVGCATVASLFPFVGTIVYMILRPPEYLEDVRERELELQAAEARLHELDYSLCPHCDYRIERDFIRCPSCSAQAEGAVRQLFATTRSCLDDLPLLRDRRAHDGQGNATGDSLRACERLGYGPYPRRRRGRAGGDCARCGGGIAGTCARGQARCGKGA